MKKSRAKQRGTSNPFEVFGSLISYPSCLAGYFTWPQVALTHHVFHRAYTPLVLRLSSLRLSNRSSTSFYLVSGFFCHHDGEGSKRPIRVERISTANTRTYRHKNLNELATDFVVG